MLVNDVLMGVVYLPEVNCGQTNECLLFLSAVEHAVKYLETKQLPSNWDDDGPEEILKNEGSDHSSSSEAESDGDENERSEFLEKLTKFLGEKG